jgi:N-acetylglucosaminyl-diphospho-decaprenol L-rhamnosyltransferase
MTVVDAVVVSFNSAANLRECVGSLALLSWVDVTVVDNASGDGSVDMIRDLPLRCIAREDNGGFALGCNEGWREGSAPFVLFLNPDASIDEQSLRRLVAELESAPATGAVGPKIVSANGSLEYSQRRFPRLRSTFSTALFLHRVAPLAAWSDEVVRDGRAYERPGSPEWISGACMLVRRSALEELRGLDETFFLYSEDTDLCRRLWTAGYEVRFEPEALCRHRGGGSAPRPSLLPLLAESRIRYAKKHHRRATAYLARTGVALSSLTHMIAARGGRPARAGHASSLRLTLSRNAGRT